jgi:hypothetical protein
MAKYISALTGQSWRVLSVSMTRLNPDKLQVAYLAGATPDKLIVPRLYTLTHSDTTGEISLSIGSEYDRVPVFVRFRAKQAEFSRVEASGKPGDYHQQVVAK